MDTIQYCPQSRKNKHLNSYERGQIALLIGNILSSYAIIKKINRTPRGSNERHYELIQRFISKRKKHQRL